MSFAMLTNCDALQLGVPFSLTSLHQLALSGRNSKREAKYRSEMATQEEQGEEDYIHVPERIRPYKLLSYERIKYGIACLGLLGFKPKKIK